MRMTKSMSIVQICPMSILFLIYHSFLAVCPASAAQSSAYLLCYRFMCSALRCTCPAHLFTYSSLVLAFSIFALSNLFHPGAGLAPRLVRFAFASFQNLL